MMITAKVVRERRRRLARSTGTLVACSNEHARAPGAYNMTELLNAAIEYANALRAVEGR